MIDIDYLKQLLEIFDSSTVNDLRIEEEGIAIRLSKKEESQAPTAIHYQVPHMPMQAPMPQPAAQAPMEPVQSVAPATEEAAAVPPAADLANQHQILSPIVGTFYRSPNPESPSYVEIGDSVSTGTVLCIVEAMKLMNEIESDVNGTVAKIFVESGQPVEYGQPLFLIETT